MKKIISAFVLMGVMTLTACGNNNNEQVTESTLVSTVAETTMATETTVATEVSTEAITATSVISTVADTTTILETTVTAEVTTTVEEVVDEAVVQTADLPAFIAEKHDLTYRVVDDVKYNTNVYNIADETFRFILVEELVFDGIMPEIKWYLYDMDGNLLFEQYTMKAVPETVCIVEDNETTAIVVGIAQLRQHVFYKYNITESKVIETLYENAVETDNEVTYYVTIDGEEKVLYKSVRTDDGWEKDYSVSEMPFAEITEVYNAYTASN